MSHILGHDKKRYHLYNFSYFLMQQVTKTANLKPTIKTINSWPRPLTPLARLLLGSQKCRHRTTMFFDHTLANTSLATVYETMNQHMMFTLKEAMKLPRGEANISRTNRPPIRPREAKDHNINP